MSFEIIDLSWDVWKVAVTKMVVVYGNIDKKCR